jgi:hypothetical protein
MSYSNRALRTLSDDEIRRFAPSVFAEEAHESRSERYTYIPTSAVLAGLRKEGFAVVSAKQSRTRDASRTEFTKHMLRLRHANHLNPTGLNESVPEIVLVNSHDGTSAYQLTAGLFRLVCLNGLMVSDGNYSAVHVHHKGDVIGKVIEGAYTVLDDSSRALAVSNEWAHVALDQGEREVMAEAAHVLRFGDAEGKVDTPIRPAQLLQPQRYGDNRPDLWTTFNVIQENTIRGGLRAWGRDANNRPRRVSSREVKGIDQDVKLNKALWLLTERMAELKGAPIAA